MTEGFNKYSSGHLTFIRLFLILLLLIPYITAVLLIIFISFIELIWLLITTLLKYYFAIVQQY